MASTESYPSFEVPSIGTKVYCIGPDHESIIKDTVMFLGAESFITSKFGDSYYEEGYHKHYCDYGTTWFTNVRSAKRFLRNYWREADPLYKRKVKKISDDYWEVVDY